jgi:hypothetical protein
MPEVPSNFTEFDAKAAGEALGAEPHTTRDVAHGDGEALNVGETTLEIYPDAGVARVTTKDARIELFRVPNYSITRQRIVFEKGDPDDRTRLQLRADGKVAFHPVLRAADASRTGETPQNGDKDFPADHITPETSTGPQAPQSPEGAKSGEVEQQVLLGRLGRDPWYSHEGDQSIAGFPLATNDEQGKTTWHRVVVSGQAAEEVQAAALKRQIKKGRLVQVTGVEVTRQEPTARGGTRPVKEFHASSVQKMYTGTVPHPKGR